MLLSLLLTIVVVVVCVTGSCNVDAETCDDVKRGNPIVEMEN